nr:hypothetical protein [uncultured Actinoplanes sp.]
MAGWLLNRHLLRRVELWNQDVAGEMSRQLVRALVVPGSVNRAATQLRAVAVHVAGSREDFEREADSDKPALEPETGWNSSSPYVHRVRQKQLAVLLAVAGVMAFDARQADDAIVNHIGIRDRIRPVDVLSTIDESRWNIDAERQVMELSVACPHPAVHLAWESQAGRINGLLDWLHDNIQPGGAELTAALPHRASTRHLEPQYDDSGAASYERPLLGFRLDHDEIRELLMGVRLYGDPSLAVRELYQNALDACRYRRARHAFLDRDYHGQIAFRQGVAEDGRRYIECEDNGVGMGRQELEQLFSRAGRRFVTSPEFLWEQAKWRNEKPQIKLWPNSRFGIGVFSYFMIADEITITSARVDRRTLAADEVLRVDISSSGSLFRIRTVPEAVSQGGTTVRLYLRDHHVSALDTLRRLLWYSEFDVSCVDREDQENWSAGVLHGVGKPTALTADEAGEIWFVAGNGRVLADGIATAEERFGYVVNLTREHAAVLSVDRNKLEEWDSGWVQEKVIEAAGTAVMLSEPTFQWLWSVVLSDPIVGEAVWLAMYARDAWLPLEDPRPHSYLLPNKSDEPAGSGSEPEEEERYPVRAVGGFPFDRMVMTSGPSAAGLDVLMLMDAPRWEAVALARLAVAKKLGAFRRSYSLLADQARSRALGQSDTGPRTTVDLMGGAMPSAAPDLLYPTHVELLPTFDPPMHALITDVVNLERFGNRMESRSPTGWFVTDDGGISVNAGSAETDDFAAFGRRAWWLSVAAGWPLERLLRRLRSLVVFGYPTPGPQRTAEPALASADPEFIGQVLRQDTWLQAFDVLVAESANKKIPLGTVRLALNALDEIGLSNFGASPSSGDEDFICSEWEVELMRTLLEWEDYTPNNHWLDLAAALEVTLEAHPEMPPVSEAGLTRLFASFADSSPWSQADRARALIGVADPDDLILLSRDADGVPPWVFDTVSVGHIERLSAELGISLTEVWRRLEIYAAELGLVLPPYAQLAEAEQEARSFEAAEGLTEEDFPWGDVIDGDDVTPADDPDDDYDFGFSDPATDLADIDRIHLSASLSPADGNLLAVITPGHVAAVACFLDQAVGPVLTRLTKLAQSFDLEIPAVEAGAAEIVPTKDDLVILSAHNNGQAPWIEGAPSVLQIATAAFRVRKPIGFVCRRIVELRPLMPSLPTFPSHTLESFAAVMPDLRDLACLTADVRIDGRPLSPDVSPIHVVRVAARFATECAEIVQRLATFAHLGIDLSRLPEGPWASAVPTWHDLILLTVECRATTPLPPGPLPENHVRWSAYSIGETEEFVLERLRLWHPLFGYELPATAG